MTDKQKHKIVGVVALIIITFVIIRHAVFDQREIKDGVYVVGKLYKKGIQGKNARIIFYYYNYSGRVYTTKLQPAHADHLIFLKISKSHPEFSLPVNIEVPGCLTLESVPIKGWEQTPIDSCR